MLSISEKILFLQILNEEKMVVYNAYDQIAELIAELNPAKVMAMKANEELQNRFESLVEKSKESSLNLQEKDELDHYVVLERLIRLAKIRSHERKVA
jgi:predicted nucleic acid-binding protein